MRATTASFALGVVVAVTGCGGSSSSGGAAGGNGSAIAGGGTTANGGATASGGSGVSSGGTATGSGGTIGTIGTIGKFTSTVPGTDVLGNLSDADYAKLCGDATAYFGSSGVGAALNELLCRTLGITLAQGTTDAAIQAACKSVYDQCTTGATSSGMCDAKPSAACMATVTEYEACLNDTASAYESLLAMTPTCAQLTQATLPTAVSNASAGPTEPASCKAAEQKCPELAPMSGGMM